MVFGLLSLGAKAEIVGDWAGFVRNGLWLGRRGVRVVGVGDWN